MKDRPPGPLVAAVKLPLVLQPPLVTLRPSVTLLPPAVSHHLLSWVKDASKFLFASGERLPHPVASTLQETFAPFGLAAQYVLRTKGSNTGPCLVVLSCNTRPTVAAS